MAYPLPEAAPSGGSIYPYVFWNDDEHNYVCLITHVFAEPMHAC